jgi:hypothetical protein
VNGEWSYYLILDQFLSAPAESRRAAMGWAGDRYEVYEGSLPDQVLIVQLSAWDSENDAREFFAAYAKRTERRYPDAQIVDAGPAMASGDLRKWQTKEGEVFLERRNERVLILEGLPAGSDRKLIAYNLWR